MSLLIKLLAVLIALSTASVTWPAAAVLARATSTPPGPNPAQLLPPPRAHRRHHRRHGVRSVRGPRPPYPPRRDVQPLGPPAP
ncbi:hypothetical protein GQ55_9G187200 [Panicum hallii var. hallii]|uniref:Secreted protein n=1 Tax=Panicum hallii var. hallii TaxID=1504633 RepID=A0A2T7C4P9_9POAL|nr:hypothetical protein GQ55_9G187200 [Panicum hallii var. hallii]